MAGHRARSGRELLTVESVQKRQAASAKRLAEARGPRERVYAAMEGARSALALLPLDRAGELADLLVERACQVAHDAYEDAIAMRRKPDDRRH